MLAEANALVGGRRPARSDSADGLFVGVDLGTASLVLTVVDSAGRPLAVDCRMGRVVRDGLVLDFPGAVQMLAEMKRQVEADLGRELHRAASGYPPGVPAAEVRTVAHVLESAGLECVRLIDEPSAANLLLGIPEGVIVDVGGGTTGVALVRDGSVTRTADEATGGTHFTLVIAGGLDVTLDEAEALKLQPEEQPRLFPMVRPVMEKVGAIVARFLDGETVPIVHLVGGASAFLEMDEVLQDYLDIPVQRAAHPAWVTPIGLALAHAALVREPALTRN
jgi:ethanolamine utilization protein EutJ